MNAASSPNTQKLKLLLIPVLALALGWVLLWPADDEAAEDQPLTTLVRPTSTGIAPVGGPPNAQLWKGIDLTLVSQTNPFRPIEASASTKVDAALGEDGQTSAQTGETSSGVKRITRSVLAVIHRNGKAYACIDNEVAAVGDTLADGTRVVAITAETVLLEAAQ